MSPIITLLRRLCLIYNSQTRSTPTYVLPTGDEPLNLFEFRAAIRPSAIRPPRSSFQEPEHFSFAHLPPRYFFLINDEAHIFQPSSYPSRSAARARCDLVSDIWTPLSPIETHLVLFYAVFQSLCHLLLDNSLTTRRLPSIPAPSI
jgi:hypothetical protein